MNFETHTDSVEFEIPDLAAALRLAKRLRPYWPLHVAEQEDVAFVSAEFDSRGASFAHLLRSVESWVADEGLYAIRYEVDGRYYVLEAGEADWAEAV